LWAVKIGLHLLFCLGLLVLMAAPLAVQSQFRNNPGHTLLSGVFRSALFDELGRQGWKYLLVPAAYGFAAGHLAGLMFRKLVVACGVAGIVGAVGAALWLPSLLAGGTLHWQVWLPPAVALLTGRLLMRAWASGRPTDRGPLTTLVGGCLAAGLVLAAGVGYRVLEVPDRPDGQDDVGYVAGLLPFDLNVAGNSYKTAAERYARLAAQVGPEPEPRAPRVLGAARGSRPEERLVWAVARGGWPADDPDLDGWMDRMFGLTSGDAEGDDWYAAVAAAATQPTGIPGLAQVLRWHLSTWYATAGTAAEHPPGIYQHPQTISLTGASAGTLENARRMAFALVGRGLKRQAEGDPAEFVTTLRVTLGLAWNLRNGGGVDALKAGIEVERTALAAIDRWLTPPPGAAWALGLWAAPGPVPAAGAAWVQKIAPSPALARQAAALLEAGDPTGPFDPTPYLLAERFALREAQKAPGQWLPQRLAPDNPNSEAAGNEAELVALGWAVPWERERTRRLLGLGFESGPPKPYRLLTGRPGADFLALRLRGPGELAEQDRLLRGFRRAAVLKLALYAYKADRGHYPDDPAELVAAGYLRRVPPDPYDEARPLGYRVSPGETLQPAQPTVTPAFLPTGGGSGGLVVQAGQVVLWSVGPDRADQGGRTAPGGGPAGAARPEDLVYLVPVGFAP
jgi:hypothetical protein